MNQSLDILFSSEGQRLLDSLPPYRPANSLDVNQALRKNGVTPELAAALLTQSRLRSQAISKFGDLANQMLFTQAGLEQATRNIVAKTHAERYVAASCKQIADITCGIGADSLAFAQAGLRVTACELDPETAQIATWNLREFPSAQVVCADGIQVAKSASFQGIYADPARRTAAGRKFNLEDFIPPLSKVLELRSRTPAVGIKVGPGISHDDVPTEAEAQWVSVAGELVECGLWFGPLAARGPGRSALLLTAHPNGDTTSRLIHDDEAAPALEVGPVGQYLYEPDKAVIRAGLLPVAAAELGAHQLDATIAYLTGDQPPVNLDDATRPAIATAYRVLEVMPFKVKQLKSYLRQRGIGAVTIKKRGTAITPEQLRPQLGLKGPNQATIVLTRIAGQHSVLVVEPVTS